MSPSSSSSLSVSSRPSDLHVAVRRRRLNAVAELLAADVPWTAWLVGDARMDPLQLAEAMDDYLTASGRHDEASRVREIAHRLRRHKDTKENANLLSRLRRLRSKYSELRTALRSSEEDASEASAAKTTRLRQVMADTKATLALARDIIAPKKKKASEKSASALESFNCVVCWTIPPDVVLCCPTCETLLCKICADRLSRSVCPCCRAGFGEVAPKRSRAVERIVQGMRAANHIEDEDDDNEEEEEDDDDGITVGCAREHDQAQLILTPSSTRSTPTSTTSSASSASTTPLERLQRTIPRLGSGGGDQPRGGHRRLTFDLLDEDLDMVDARLFCCCS